jgi:hypothetical protein
MEIDKGLGEKNPVDTFWCLSRQAAKQAFYQKKKEGYTVRYVSDAPSQIYPGELERHVLEEHYNYTNKYTIEKVIKK